MFFKKVWPTLAVAFLLAVWCTPVLAGQTPTERIKEGVKVLSDILSEPAMQDPAQHDAAVARLRAIAEDYVDFGLVTKYAVGRPWLNMSDDLRQQIKDAFMKLLEKTYLQQIPGYSGQHVQYSGETIEGSRAKVQAELQVKDTKNIVEFRLKIVNGKWMIYDIVAEGVSLVMNYRSQFSEVLKKGNGVDLLKAIQDRIAQLEQERLAEQGSVQ